MVKLYLLVVLCFLFHSQSTQAQSESHNFITYDTAINAPYAGILWRVRISRPANMFTPNNADTASRPAIITIPGQGEMGSSAGLQAYGPHYWLNNGWDGSVILGNGTHYPILVTINSTNTYMTAQEANDVIEIILNTYHIKKNSVHVAGLSQGAFALSGMILFESVAGGETGMKKIKSLVCLEGASSELQYPYSSWSLGEPGWGHWAKKYGGKFFGLEGIADYRVVSRVSKPMNDSMPGSAYFAYENIGGGSHCCWNSMYNPSTTNWRCISPLASNIVTGADPNTMGTYRNPSNIFQWMLRQGDTSMVGNSTAPPANKPPVANAGLDKTITLPTNSATLNGTATDADGTIASYQWTKIAGPTQFTIVSPLQAQTVVSGLVQGIYQFELRVSDNAGAIAKDTVQVTVNAVSNLLPVANAGSDQIITLPSNSVSLSGIGTDADGTIASYQWAKITGPTQFTITSPTQAQTTVSGLVQGIYQFELKVTDNTGAIAKDTVQVMVNSASNLSPVANAGADQVITLPANSVTLNGSGTDADGTIASYQWTKLAGPTQFTIASSMLAQTSVSGLVQGVYLFELRVVDNLGASARDTMQVVVNALITNGKYIKVNIYGGVNPYNSPDWNNWNIKSSSNFSSPKYSDGTSSTVKIRLSFGQSVNDNSATYNGGMAPAEVLRYASFSSSSRTLTITGLSSLKKYTVELYASSDTIQGCSTIFKTGVLADTVSTYDNFSHKTVFAGLVSRQGKLTIDIASLSAGNYLNGFMITEMGTLSLSGTTQANTAKIKTNSEETGTVAPSTFDVFPNPAKDNITLELKNSYRGEISVQVITGAGVVRQTLKFEKNQEIERISIPTGRLGAGIYFVRIQAGNLVESKRIIKL